MSIYEKIRKNEEYSSVYRLKKSKANRLLVMYVAPNGREYSRFGISVSKKVGNSVVRHHIKRLVKEAYRKKEAVFGCGHDIVVVARKSAEKADYHQVESALLHLKKLHHINE